MAQYFNVRGFIDCDYQDLDVIRNVVDQFSDSGGEFHLSEESVSLYLGGWVYQQREINWIAHAFFGAVMRLGGVDLVFSQLKRIAEAVPDLEGLFFVDDEEGGPTAQWKVADGSVSVRRSAAS
ncbi:hypothetical protein ACIQUQ_11305 [Streptomyces sp. NPDC101118]|uniref:hypothetical protein n=1 Tax=Streptomyces sp. NPDC101118 TaxID=3366109 RepID=UPI00380D9BD7